MRQPLLQAQFDKVPGVLKTKLGGTSAGARRLSMIEIASSFGVLVCGFGESTQLLASYPHERGHENSVVTLSFLHLRKTRPREAGWSQVCKRG